MLPKSVSFFGRFLTAGPRELSPLSLSLSVVVVLFPLNTTASLLFFHVLLCFAFFFSKENLNPSLFFQQPWCVRRQGCDCLRAVTGSTWQNEREGVPRRSRLLSPSLARRRPSIAACSIESWPPLTLSLSLSPPLFNSILQALPGQVTPEGVPSFKLVLVGDGGTGKWEMLRRKNGRRERHRRLLSCFSSPSGLLVLFEREAQREGERGGTPEASETGKAFDKAEGTTTGFVEEKTAESFD